MSTQPHKVWLHRGLLGSWALLLGVWLPFVCWGTWADPAHPHLRPHLVFAAPSPAVYLPSPAYTGHEAHTGHGAGEEGPVGPARPATQLLLLLVLALPVGYFFLNAAPRGGRRQQAMGAPQVCLPVPTPPPRAA